METEEILTKLINRVSDKLKDAIINFNRIFDEEQNKIRQLAEKLGIKVVEKDSKTKNSITRNTEKIVLLPVAEACVLAILRQLTKLADEQTEPIHVPPDRFRKFVLREAFYSTRFKRAIGLEDEKAKEAIEITGEFLILDKCFKSKQKISLNENTYIINRQQEKGGFIVERLA